MFKVLCIYGEILSNTKISSPEIEQKMKENLMQISTDPNFGPQLEMLASKL